MCGQLSTATFVKKCLHLPTPPPWKFLHLPLELGLKLQHQATVVTIPNTHLKFQFLWYFRWDLALSDYLKLYLLLLIIYFICQYWLLANHLSIKCCPQVPIYSMSNISTGSMPTHSSFTTIQFMDVKVWIPGTSHPSNHILVLEWAMMVAWSNSSDHYNSEAFKPYAHIQ